MKKKSQTTKAELNFRVQTAGVFFSFFRNDARFFESSSGLYATAFRTAVHRRRLELSRFVDNVVIGLFSKRCVTAKENNCVFIMFCFGLARGMT